MSNPLKAEELFRQLAAEFIQRESTGASLITVTSCSLSTNKAHVTIFFTVLPDHKQYEALDFVRRKKGEFSEYVKEHAKMRRIPRFEFEIDLGEKNRQRIDEISNNQAT